MEAIAEHALEPELNNPVPRRLWLPLRIMFLLSVASLLLLLFVLGSGRALWLGAKLCWLARSGHTVGGRITVIETEPSLVKDQPPQQTAFRYDGVIPGPHGPRSEAGWIVLSAPSTPPGSEKRPGTARNAPRYHLGQSFPLRYASLLGVTICQPWGPNPGSRILTLFLAGGLVLSVSVLLLRRLVRWTGSRLHLLRYGVAAIGTITHKRSESEDKVRYFLRYGYADSVSQGQDREEQVNADQWHKFQIGQPVTVLYDPEHPQQAGLYALIRQW